MPKVTDEQLVICCSVDTALALAATNNQRRQEFPSVTDRCQW